MIGACWGGAFGLCFTDWVHQLHGSKIIKPAPYALMGAVAMLGGVQRSSISLVVIILEGTGAVSTTPSPPAH
jgi:chloride channel 7